jgi:hypothetical protein
MEQSKIMGYAINQLGRDLIQAQDAIERDKAIENALNSEKMNKLQQAVDPDRLHEKTQSIRQNQRIMDEVHISPEARGLYRSAQGTAPESKSSPEPLNDASLPEG